MSDPAELLLIPEPEPKLTTRPFKLLLPEVVVVVGRVIKAPVTELLLGKTLPEFKSRLQPVKEPVKVVVGW